MPIYQAIQEMLKTQAQTEDINAQTQQRVMQTLMQKKQMDAQEQAASISAQMYADANRVPQAQQEAKDVSQADNLQSAYESTMKQAQFHTDLAQRLGSQPMMWKQAEQARQDSDRLKKEAIGIQGRLLTQREADINDVGAIVNGVTDQASLDAAMPLLKQRAPMFGVPKQGQPDQFDRTDDGSVTWGDKTQAAFKAMADQSKTARQNNDLARKAQKDASQEVARQNLEDLRNSQMQKNDAQIAKILAGAPDKETPAEKSARKALDDVIKLEDKPIKDGSLDVKQATATAQVYVKQAYGGAEFDPSSMSQMGKDIAERAVQIRAEDARKIQQSGDLKQSPITITKAREQAADELSKFIRDKDVPQGVWYDPLGFKRKAVKTYDPGSDESVAKPAKTTAAPTSSGPVKINSPAERDALKPGTQYVAPDGTVRTRQ